MRPVDDPDWPVWPERVAPCVAPLERPASPTRFGTVLVVAAEPEEVFPLRVVAVRLVGRFGWYPVAGFTLPRRS